MQSKEQLPKTEASKKQEETAKTPTAKELKDDDYTTLIADNLTKDYAIQMSQFNGLILTVKYGILI